MHIARLALNATPILATKARVRAAFESAAKPFREVEFIAKAKTRQVRSTARSK